MASRTIKLLGEPLINEDGVATAAIRPGDLVDGVTSIAPHASAGAACPRTFALEREELGKGIDDTYLGAAGTSAYAIGDTVKVGAFGVGMRVNAFIASGENIAANDRMESAGDGTLRKYNAGVIIGRALTSPGAVTVLTRLPIEIM